MSTTKVETKAPGAEVKDPKKGAEEVTGKKPEVTGARKPQTQAEKDLHKANAVGVTKEITDKKELKYIYPKDATTLASRKKFRTTVRAKVKSFEKVIGKLMAKQTEAELSKSEKKELSNVTKEAELYAKEVYVQTAKKGKTKEKVAA